MLYVKLFVLALVLALPFTPVIVTPVDWPEDTAVILLGLEPTFTVGAAFWRDILISFVLVSVVPPLVAVMLIVILSALVFLNSNVVFVFKLLELIAKSALLSFPNPSIALFITKLATGLTGSPLDFLAVNAPIVVPELLDSLNVLLEIVISVGASPALAAILSSKSFNKPQDDVS